MKKIPPKRRVVDHIHTGKGLSPLRNYSWGVGVESDNDLNIKDNATRQHLVFIGSATHLYVCLKKLGENFRLQKDLSRKEMHHEEV